MRSRWRKWLQWPHDPGLNYFDLEDPGHLARLEEPKLALEPLRGLVVIDEIQLRPGLFPLLRVLADREEAEARFLILGSASRDLIRQGAETLAGRISFVEVAPFGLKEVEDVRSLWLRGGYPPAYLAERELDSCRWRRDYVKTFLERDLLLFYRGQRRGFEIKYTDTPRRTASQKLALESLQLDRLDVICPGQAHYPLDDCCFVTGIERVAEQL